MAREREYNILVSENIKAEVCIGVEGGGGQWGGQG